VRGVTRIFLVEEIWGLCRFPRLRRVGTTAVSGPLGRDGEDLRGEDRPVHVPASSLCIIVRGWWQYNVV